MDLFDAIIGRRSIRNYEDTPIEKEKVGLVLEACRWSPSAGNRQPWEIVIVEDPKEIEKLAHASLEQTWIKSAPMILGVCINEKIARGTYGDRGELYATETIGMAIQNMMLTAYSVGLGSCCVSAFDEEEVGNCLGCIETVKPMALITLGYPKEDPSPPFRDDVSNFTFYNKHGRNFVPNWKGAVNEGKKVGKRIIESLKKC